jgi:hypothetical protein
MTTMTPASIDLTDAENKAFFEDPVLRAAVVSLAL